jgi:TatD DNase family protein
LDQTNNPQTPFIDTHSHSEAGPEIIQILNQDFTSKDHLQYEYDLQNKTIYSIGFHPWNFKDSFFDTSSLQQLIKDFLNVINLNENTVLGEIGLDRVHNESFPKQFQFLENLLNQLPSGSYRGPIVFHCVRAYQDLYQIIQKSKITNPIILHDFNGNEEMIKQFLRLDCYFSLGSQLQNSNSKLFKNLQHIPLNRVLLETDDQVNHSIIDIYQRFSELRKINLEELKETITTNFSLLFSKNTNINFEGLIS